MGEGRRVLHGQRPMLPICKSEGLLKVERMCEVVGEADIEGC